MEPSKSRTESPTLQNTLSKWTGGSNQSARCVHTISQEDRNSVLSLAASKKYLFSGSQSSKIHVWNVETFTFVTVLKGHRGSVLGLALSRDERQLFSCSGDGTVRVWDTETLKCVYLIQSCHDVGDIFSVVYSESLNTLFFGSQNTSIQWYDFADPQSHGLTTDVPAIPSTIRGICQKSKFFDCDSDLSDESDRLVDEDVIKCVIRDKNVYPNAHDGYIYCLLHAAGIPNTDGEVLISGSGDGDVKIWSVKDGTIRHQRSLSGNLDKGVLSLVLSDDGYLFCGVQGGDIQVWDLETYQLIRSIKAHDEDILAITINGSELVSASADSKIKIWSQEFECKDLLDDHNDIILSLTTSSDYLITGSSDHSIKFWDLRPAAGTSEQFRRKSTSHDELPNDTFLYVLEKLVSAHTVSGAPKYMEECRRGARLLKNVLQQLGADSRMIPGSSGHNPLVYGKFTGKRLDADSSKKTPTVLIYGHYDVIAAENENLQWQTDPFSLTGKNGYLYGRGVSDNKGPVLACIFAVNELVKEGLLDVDVIFLIEGEEENGSVGLRDALEDKKELFENVDMILLSNSYWLGEDVPCLTYGLRGVIHASIEVSNTLTDLHSGVEGGAVSEPLVDLIHILGQLVDTNKKVSIPGFYDKVRPVTEAERKLYVPIVEWMQTAPSPAPSRATHSSIGSPKLPGKHSAKKGGSAQTSDKESLTQQLMARWRNPTLTVHKIDVSINNPSTIPRCATGSVSMRIVPDQEIADICHGFKTYVEQVFKSLHSENIITVDIQSSAEPWLGKPESEFFKAAEQAIEQEWGIKPLYIREGGSIPAVRWLEKFCNAPAVHLPMGQASDQAHLHNERIRLRNLQAGRKIVKSILRSLPKIAATN